MSKILSDHIKRQVLAYLMRLHLELGENQLDPVTRRRREHPHAVLEYGSVREETWP